MQPIDMWRTQINYCNVNKTIEKKHILRFCLKLNLIECNVIELRSTVAQQVIYNSHAMW